MKRALSGLLGIMMLVMSGCGDGSVSVVVPVAPVINPPSITLNPFTQDKTAKFIDGSVTFYAPDSDIDTMTVAVYDSIGLLSRTPTIVYLPGTTWGTIPFSIDYITFPAGQFTFSIYVTDFKGITSNLVVGSFLVP